MMDGGTPLDEVVRHLPPELADWLSDKPTQVQRATLSYLRTGISAMERKGAQLDPVSYQAVVFGMGLLAIMAATSHDPSSGGTTG